MTKNRNRTHRARLVAAQGNRCCYCEVSLLPVDAKWKSATHPRAATIEHLHRRVEGGSSALDNKAVACYECNTGRGSADWLTYKSIKMGEVAA
ncbi:HNH endonuclease protein [Rhizobium phage RHph_X2_25]|nr:HNH endonuclease protein [Rhizobium phage RHph_X2_25]